MTNPLRQPRATSSAGGSVTLKDGAPVPTNIEDYAAWLNRKEKRNGAWVVVEKDGRKQVDFKAEVASADRLRSRGISPNLRRV